MGALNGVALGFLTVLPFVSLFVFSVAFTVSGTAPQPPFRGSPGRPGRIGALAEEELAPTAHRTFSPKLAAAFDGGYLVAVERRTHEMPLHGPGDGMPKMSAP